MKRTASEESAVRCFMPQYNTLPAREEGHIMFAHHIAAAQGGKADGARGAGAGDAVAAAIGDVVERDAAPGGSGAISGR